ncbi:MAG: hypothetical protein WAV47_21605 [Blastocatellia bacterium]
MQLINDALSTGDTPQGPFGIDVDALAKNARDFAQSWKSGWSGTASPNDAARTAREIRREAREEARRRNLPKPKEYLHYSWQHNLKSGLASLFWGTGFGVVLYYLGQNAIDHGLIQKIEESSRGHVQGLEPIVRIIWLIALLPVLKGLAQITYAAFFGESMATLAERFTPPPLLEAPAHSFRQDTAPVAERESMRYEPIIEPPSVTERTTHIFDETQQQMKRETQ